MLDATQIFDGTLPNTGVAITTTRVSTNVLDMLTARDIGNGDALYLNVLVIDDFTAAGAATLTVQYEVSATAGGTYSPLIVTPPIPVAALIPGQRIASYVIPPNQPNNVTVGVLNAPGQFVRLTYTVATGPMTAGSVMAWISARPDRDCYYTYPRNYTVYIDPDQLVV